MKRNHKITLGGKTLTLSVSFATSLDILDTVESPSKIVESIMQGVAAERRGETYESEFTFTERNSVKIIELANKPYEGLTFEEIGELVMEDNILKFYGQVLDYLIELTMGRSRAPEVETGATSSEK